VARLFLRFKTLIAVSVPSLLNKSMRGGARCRRRGYRERARSMTSIKCTAVWLRKHGIFRHYNTLFVFGLEKLCICFCVASHPLTLAFYSSGKGKGGAPFSLIVEDVAEENNVGVPLSANIKHSLNVHITTRKITHTMKNTY
jgi:hypothetical protein